MLLMLLALLAAPVRAEPLPQAAVAEAYYRSLVHESAADYSSAAQALAPVLAAWPEGYTVNLRLGWLAYLGARHGEAIGHYRKAVQAAPGALEAKLGLVLPLLALQKLDEALQVIQQVIAVDRYNDLANLRLATILRLQGKAELAERVCREMLALYPTALTFMTELARAKLAQSDRTAAAVLYADILILDPGNVEARAFLAVP